MTKLDRYELLEPLGHGGMADVWRARTGGGDHVAVKLLRSEFSDEILRREVQMMARLDHPSIVCIRRWGDVQEGEGTELGLVPGTPWIAMDLATQGSLESHTISSFRSLQRLALQLLDALAHAHARGVIHRDIKPANILVAGSAEEPRYVLTDFGIAFPRTATRHGTDEVRYAAAGTLYYMAPEQVLGHWRDFDAYTDLFSLGVVLYELVAGHLPFVGNSRVQLAMAHPRGMPDIESAGFAVPAGFTDWLKPFLAFNPTERHAFAADAIHQLLTLDPIDAPDRRVVRRTMVESATTLPLSWMTDTLVEKQRATRDWKMRAAIHLGGVSAPVIDDWRSTRDTEAASPMGLELFGLRRAGIVGRETERDVLWQTLLRTIRSETCGALVLRGPNGIGCARMMRWLGERAAELGMAALVRVHRRRGSSAVADTLSHELGLVGLNSRDRRERIAEIFAEAEVDIDLIALAASGADLPMGDQVHVVREVLGATSHGRPLIVMISEAHDDLEALEYAPAMVGSPLPILFVLAVNEEALETAPFQAERLLDLQENDHCVVQHLAPLTTSAMGRLVDTVHPLAPEERRAVIAQASGNVLHALQLIELVAVDEGVQGGALPEVWRQRVAHALGSVSDEPLLVAAVLGDSVPVDVWRRLCRKTNVEIPDEFVDLLVRSRLWEVDDCNYRFEHRSLRAAILAAPGRAERLRELHLEAVEIWSNSHLAGRTQRGRHFVAARRFDEAARRLFGVVNMLLFEGRQIQARSLVHWLHLQLATDERAESEAGEYLRLIDAQLAQKEGETHRARELARSVAEHAEHRRWWELAAEARRVDSLASEYLGANDEALEAARNAHAHADRSDDQALRSRVYSRLGRNHIRAGRYAEARAALETAAEATDPTVRLQAMTGLAIALDSLGEVDAARDVLTEGAEVAARIGARVQRGHVLHALADLEQQTGNLAAARTHLLDSFELLRRTYPEYLAQHLLNRAALELAARDASAAEELLREGLAETDPNSFTAAFGEILQAVLAALNGDVHAWEGESSRLASTLVPGVPEAHLWYIAATAWDEVGELERMHAALDAAERALQGVDGARAKALREEISVSRRRQLL